MTLNLRIANLRRFSDVLNRCTKPVELTTPDGAVHRFPDDAAAADLRRCRPAKGIRLPVAVRIHAPQDYFNIVSYYAGDC